MILLFDNVVEDSVLTSLNASLNYPVENLKDSVLTLRYQSSVDTDTITITFDENEIISDFWYAFTNATFLELKLWSGSDGLLYTLTIDDPESDIDAYHFSDYDADYATIYIEGYGGVYLGGVGLGDAVKFPDPYGEWEEPFLDNSTSAQSRAGQSLQDYVEPLRVHGFTFRDIIRDDMNFYQELYKDLGVGKAIYIDPFEKDHTFMKPIYAIMTQSITASKNGRIYDFNLNIREAR